MTLTLCVVAMLAGAITSTSSMKGWLSMPSRTATSYSIASHHQDQATRTTDRAEPKPPTAPPSLDPLEDDPAQRSRKRNNLAIGAPLTAALIGGALVFENLANAGELVPGDQDASTALSEAEALATLETDDSSAHTNLSFRSEADSGKTTADLGSVDVEDLAPASSGSEPGPIAPSAAPGTSEQTLSEDTAHEVRISQPATEGSAGVGLNFFSIDINADDEVEIDGDPFVEDTVLSRNTIIGTPGDDVLEGTEGHDRIIGASGDDIIYGRGGSDVLSGNEGNDELHGGTGQDRLYGGSGNDVLEGGDDDDLDLLNGGPGDDILIVDGEGDLALESLNNEGDDLQIVRDGYAEERGTSAEGTTFVFADNVGKPLPEGAASHTQSMSNGIENLSFEGDVDYDVFADDFDNRLTGNDGDNLIHAGGGDDILIGGAGSDRLIGGDGSDDLSGGTGNDRLDGGDRDDVLRGGAGDDILRGGLGEDELYGEGGNDSFVLGLNDVAIDSVFDHEGANRLVLEGVGDEVIEASFLGNDLYVTADRTPVAMVSDYVGNEGSLAGIDFGQGLKTVSELLVDNPDLSTRIAEIEATQADAIANDPLLAHDDLTDPTKIDTEGKDRLNGTEGDDWLSGLDGKDHLYGFEGNDILEGGSDGDLLRGGAGDDLYLFNAGDDGISDKIDDHEGQNYAKLEGFGRGEPDAIVVGNDLRVFANDDLIFTVKEFVGHEESFIGVQSGERFYETDDLLA